MYIRFKSQLSDQDNEYECWEMVSDMFIRITGSACIKIQLIICTNARYCAITFTQRTNLLLTTEKRCNLEIDIILMADVNGVFINHAK